MELLLVEIWEMSRNQQKKLRVSGQRDGSPGSQVKKGFQIGESHQGLKVSDWSSKIRNEN